jgi:ribosome-binding factor A
MTSFSRADRVSGLIQEVLSDILRREMADPRLAMATITGVKMSTDLRVASIYFTISGGEKKVSAAAEAFDRARGFIKKKLARQLELRYMPELRFFHDGSFDYGSRIESLLKSVTTENGKDNSTN